MYLRKGRSVSENDVDNYFLVAGKSNCYEVDDSGTIDIVGKDPEDAEKIQSKYNSIAKKAKIK